MIDNQQPTNEVDLQALIPAYGLMAVTGGVITGWLYGHHPELPIWKFDVMALLGAILMFIASMFLMGVILAVITAVKDESTVVATLLRIGFHLMIPAHFGGAIVSLGIIVISYGQAGWCLLVNQLCTGSMGLVILRAAEKNNTFDP